MKHVDRNTINKTLAMLLVVVALLLVRNPFPDVDGNFHTAIEWGIENEYGDWGCSGAAGVIVDAYLLNHNLTENEFPVYIPSNDEAIPKPSNYDWFNSYKFLVAVGCVYGIYVQKYDGSE